MLEIEIQQKAVLGSVRRFFQDTDRITINKDTFSGYKPESLIFHEGVKYITFDEEAFDGCISLTSIVFPKGVKSITFGKRAFQSCRNLTSIVIPEGVEDITFDKEAFRFCVNLTSIDIPGTVEDITINDSAFCHCESLKSLFFRKGVKNITIGNGAFFSSSIESIVFPEGVKSITFGGTAFYGCESLKSIDIPEGVEEITFGEGAFHGCGNLKSIVFPRSVKKITIGKGAFAYCRDIEFLDFPEDVEITIGDEAFDRCESLKSLVFRQDVNNITIGNRPSKIFWGCDKLVSFDFPEKGLDIKVVDKVLSLVPEVAYKKTECFINIIKHALTLIEGSVTLTQENKTNLLESLKDRVETRCKSDSSVFFGDYFNGYNPLITKINDLQREEVKYVVRGRGVELTGLHRPWLSFLTPFSQQVKKGPVEGSKAYIEKKMQ